MILSGEAAAAEVEATSELSLAMASALAWGPLSALADGRQPHQGIHLSVDSPAVHADLAAKLSAGISGLRGTGCACQ
jgi:hypothetical protein